jgi:SHAQKYF class myb-like DNA-binding protein
MSSERQLEPWTPEQHRKFAMAIFEAGMRNSSPAVILQNMSSVDASIITNERVKSHLQKYRANKERNKEEFLDAYDNWMHQVKSITSDLHRPPNSVVTADDWRVHNPNVMFQLQGLMNPENQGLGEMAAYLSFSVMMHDKIRNTSSAAGGGPSRHTRHRYSVNQPMDQPISRFLAYESVRYPQMTEEEKSSPLGQGLEHAMKLLLIIKSHVVNQRQSQFRQQVPMISSGEQNSRGARWVHRSSASRPSPRPEAFKYMGNFDSHSETSMSPQTTLMLEAVADAAATMPAMHIPPSEDRRHHDSHEYYHHFPSRKRSREVVSVYDVHDTSSPPAQFMAEARLHHTILMDRHGGGGRNEYHPIGGSERYAGPYVAVTANQASGHHVDRYSRNRVFSEDWSPGDEERRDNHVHEEQSSIPLQRNGAVIHWRPRNRQTIRQGEHSLPHEGTEIYQRLDDTYQRDGSEVSHRLPDTTDHWDPPRN